MFLIIIVANFTLLSFNIAGSIALLVMSMFGPYYMTKKDLKKQLPAVKFT